MRFRFLVLQRQECVVLVAAAGRPGAEMQEQINEERNQDEADKDRQENGVHASFRLWLVGLGLDELKGRKGTTSPALCRPWVVFC